MALIDLSYEQDNFMKLAVFIRETFPKMYSYFNSYITFSKSGDISNGASFKWPAQI